jgi:DNA helicase-2/ATP-dependent DNA helicase PcrA
MAVIDRNPFRTPKRLFTDRGEGLKVHLHEAFDDRVEAAYVVDTLAGLVARERAQPGDFAVMYRTNAQSRLLEEAFLHAGLPYRLVGAQRFYGRREVKDIIAYLRLVHNPNDELSLTRIINVPPRGIGNKTFLGLRTYAQKLRISPGAVVLSMGQAPDREAFAGRSGAALENFGKRLGEWRLLAEEAPPLNLMDRILEDTGYQSYLDDGTEEGQERWENVMELRRLAAEYQEQGLEAFLEQVALVSDQDTLVADANVPTLLTLHAAKGLEFPGVFIVGLNDGTLPHSRSFDDPEAMQEERRLLYVGITRAKDRLYLTYSQNRSAYGYSEPAIPSRFIEDIPPQLFDGSQPQRPARPSRATYSRPERWQVSSPASNARIVKQRFQPGVRVEHNVWGDGMVLNSRIQDDDEIVDIFFENVGLKRVAASLAKLVIKT